MFYSEYLSLLFTDTSWHPCDACLFTMPASVQYAKDHGVCKINTQVKFLLTSAWSVTSTFKEYKSACTACNTCSLLSTRQLKVVFVLKVTYSFMLWLNERWVAKCTNQSVIREILHSVCVDRWTNVLILWKHALFYPSIHVCVLLCIVTQRYSFRVFLPYLKHLFATVVFLLIIFAQM